MHAPLLQPAFEAAPNRIIMVGTGVPITMRSVAQL
jgi:hypothetical protein